MDSVTYQRKLEVLKEQEELIEDEKEQEAREETARRRKREAEERAKQEEESRLAESLLPDSELQPSTPAAVETQDARMTVEQLGELGEALLIVSARSSCLKERKALRALMQENLSTDEDPAAPKNPLAKRIRNMLTKIDKQLDAYDKKVGSSLQLVQMDPNGRPFRETDCVSLLTDSVGRISVQDLEQALKVIKHAPEPEVVKRVVKKLDVDDDGYVLLEHVLDLVGEEGLGE